MIHPMAAMTRTDPADTPQREAMDVIIDCDPGIDDSVAILFALASPKIRVRAITTVSGNLQAAACAQNALKILTLSGRQGAAAIPVAKGRQTPLVRPYPKDPFSHGADGLGELGIQASPLVEDGRFAPDVIVETAHAVLSASGGTEKLTIYCLGPLTNLTLAVMKDPELPSKVDRVLCIAGSFGFHSTGTVRSTGDNPVSEWNVYVDPEAADIVFNAGFNLFAIGLDVATRPDVEFQPVHLQMLVQARDEHHNPAADFLLGVIDWGHSQNFDTWCTTIDSIAIAASVDPEIVKFEDVRVAVETSSKLSLGQTIIDRREKFAWLHLPHIMAACDIDPRRFLDVLINTLCSD